MNGFDIFAHGYARAVALRVHCRTAAHAAFAASAVAAGAPLEFYKLENAPPGMTLPFSEAVRAGDMLYLAGMVGTDASGKLVAGGIKAETKQIMDNIGADLHAARLLVRPRRAVHGRARRHRRLAGVQRGLSRRYFKEHFPARMAFAASGACARRARRSAVQRVVGGKIERG